LKEVIILPLKEMEELRQSIR